MIQEFLDTSYTAFHAVANIVTVLEQNGFKKLYAGEKWNLTKGGRYYVVKNGTAVVAFVVGNMQNYAFNIAESHTDSPCLKIKGNTLLDSAEGKKLNVEKYGGLVLYSMVDIPLKIAGRVVEKGENGIKSRLVESDFFVNIPGLAIHHNPEVNDKCALNVQIDMCPLVGDADDVYSMFGENILDGDLYVVPAVKSFISGKNGEFLASPRIDNLTSVYASINALIKSNPTGVAVAGLFDNEEIGSLTKQGAQSAFLPEVLKSINSALGYGEEEYIKAKNNGFILSIDNGHAVSQSHPEKSDPAEKVFLNKGIVIKHHPNYSTDGVSSATIKGLLQDNGIEYQDYYNRSDLRCGGTLGLMSSALLQMNACDIGLAQLAMHSAIETVGRADIEKMEKCVEVFFNANFTQKDETVLYK